MRPFNPVDPYHASFLNQPDLLMCSGLILLWQLLLKQYTSSIFQTIRHTWPDCNQRPTILIELVMSIIFSGKEKGNGHMEVISSLVDLVG
jgi:hypothetical protein